jgi:hypothetical protein
MLAMVAELSREAEFNTGGSIQSLLCPDDLWKLPQSQWSVGRTQEKCLGWELWEEEVVDLLFGRVLLTQVVVNPVCSQTES